MLVQHFLAWQIVSWAVSVPILLAHIFSGTDFPLHGPLYDYVLPENI